jgi:hypothetical protein
MTLNPEEVRNFLRRGRYAEWNAFRDKYPEWIPDLQDMDLSGFDLRPFNLTNSNLCGAMLAATELGSTILNVNGMNRPRLKGAVYDAGTQFPPGFRADEAGAEYLPSKAVESRKVAASLRVFISYAWADKDVVSAVDQWLQDRQIRTLIDSRDFFAGSRIRDEIIREMQISDVILFFYSHEASQRPWLQFERELAFDLEIEAKRANRPPPRSIYFVMDGTPLPSVTDRSRLAIQAKGKRFPLVCEELYHNILGLTRSPGKVDLSKWENYVFG